MGLVVLLAALASLATGATARGLPGSSTLGFGLSDDPVFLEGPSSVRVGWLDRAQAIGSQAVRVGVLWAAIAPSSRPSNWREDDPRDPHYRWARLDAAVTALAGRGERVLLMAWYAPTWAEQGLPSGLAYAGAWNPNPRDFGQFAHALAVRYSGHFKLNGHTLPRVSRFQVWNEPNLSRYLLPQWYRSSSGAFAPASPGVFRGLLNAFYAGVKAAQPSATVITGGTAPFGDANPGGDRMQPALFLRGLFCLTPSLHRAACPGGAPHLDGLDHHSYSPWYYHALLPDDVSTPDLGRIWRIVHAAQRQHTVLPAGRKSLWMTELGSSSTPPDAAHLLQQAHDLDLDLYTLWSEDVSDVFWFSIEDPLVGPGNFIANGGLYFMNGQPKPAAAAYRFPFVAVPAGHDVVILWGRAPRTGRVVIQRRDHSRWTKVTRLSTTRGGIFYARIRLSGAPTLRATIGGTASPSWVPGS